MLVSVTGGTGFVGAHSVAAMVNAGHRVRLLVRDRSKVDLALAPLGIGQDTMDRIETVVGDVLDETSVARLVRGTDAVLHAASVYSFDSRQYARMRKTNARGTELVLDAARRAGADPVIHVSTVAALFPSGGRPLRSDSPVGSPRETYLATKAQAEVIARRHQAAGAPVVITYPPALLGPDDPNRGDQTTRVRNVLRGRMPLWPRGGLPLGDVRDTALLHARLLSAREGGNRHFGPSHYVSTAEFVQALRDVTGRALPTAFLPAGLMLPVGRLASRLQRVWPWHIPAEYGAVYTIACNERVSPAASTLGIEPRAIEDTMRSTVHWLHRTGRISANQAGTIAQVSTQ
jgi:nucleoside-diphosphate-sugar epimerase